MSGNMHRQHLPALVAVLLIWSHLVAPSGPATCSRGTDGVECSDSMQQQSAYTEPCASPPPPPQLQGEPQTWQEVQDRKVIVFSAYMERRPEAGGPAVRVIASGWQAEYNDIGALYCQLWYEHMEAPVTVGPAQYLRIYPSTLHHDMWVSHFIMCPLPPNIQEAPYAVSVTPSPCTTLRNTLLVLGRQASPPSNTHALCISPVYNHFRNWTMIAEWFEMHKLLGAVEITIYSFSVSAETQRILQHYANDSSSSKVNVVQWPFPSMLKSNVWCQRCALNDCLYRMGLKHKYVSVTDLDEILVPRSTSSWPDLLKVIDTPHRGAFLFQHAYFRRNSTGELPYLITQQSLWRTPEVVPPGKIRCKAMYKAELVIKIDLHFPYQLVEGADEYIVAPAEGMLHHYRCEPMETFRKRPERYTYIEDNFMTRYKEELTDRVTRVLKQLKKT